MKLKKKIKISNVSTYVDWWRFDFEFRLCQSVHLACVRCLVGLGLEGPEQSFSNLPPAKNKKKKISKC